MCARGDVRPRGAKVAAEGGGVECGQQQIEARLVARTRSALCSLLSLASDGLADTDARHTHDAAARTSDRRASAPASTHRRAALSISKWQALR